MYRYAQIDLETGIVVSDSRLSGEINYPYMIPISDDFDLTNKKYVNGEWVEYEPEPEPVPKPTQLDTMQQNQLALMEAVADQYEEHLQNRINDMEVQASIYEAVLALGGE